MSNSYNKSQIITFTGMGHPAQSGHSHAVFPTLPAPALHAGAATSDITPQDPVFLYGYPHVPRTSTGVHDRLESAALYLRQEGQGLLIIANDLIFVPRQVSAGVRRRISIKT